MRNKYLLIIVFIISVFIPLRNCFAQTAEPVEIEAKKKPTPVYPIFQNWSGDLTFKYKGRHEEGVGGSDQDISESLKVRYGNEYQNKISAYFHGKLRLDMDDTSSFFRSIDDTYDTSLRGNLYELYSVIKDVGFIDSVKIGRQYSYEVEDLHFDGINLTFSPFKNFRFSSFAGIPVYFSESSSDGDWIGGLSAEVKPLKNSTLKFDYTASSDNNDDIGEHDDSLVILSIWQRIKPWWNLYGRYSRLDSVSRDVQLISSWNFPSINLDVQFSYYKQPQLLDNSTVEFDEFVPIMGGYEPYDQYTIDVYKGIADHMGVNFGISLRELKDESDERSFNHDYERYYLTFSLYDLPIKGLSFSVTGEDYETSGDDVQSLSFDTTYEIKRNFKISGGTYYSLFKYDSSIAPGLTRSSDILDNEFSLANSLSREERDNVRSYYLKAKKKIFGRWEISGKYEFEKFNTNTFHTLETALKLKF